MHNPQLTILFRAIALLQLAVAFLNLFLVPLLKWREDLLRAPLLLREVFQVHTWFISITLTLFAVLTFRFAPEFTSHRDSVATWLGAGIGMFWLIRAVLQVTYYSRSHWRGRLGLTAIHIALLLLYGGMAAVYLCASFNS